jgi:hypothetical protein
MDKWDRETNASFLRREGEKFRKRGDAECQWYFEVADHLVADGARIKEIEAERDRAWNEAIEAAARQCDDLRADLNSLGETALRAMGQAVAEDLGSAIRSLAKEATE